MAKILVVDDELGIRDLLFEILNDEGHTVELAENAAQARAARLRGAPDLVLLDIWMPDTDGVTLLKEWRGAGLLTMPVVMMSGHATIDTAVETTRIGAQSFLEKPITLQKLLKSVETALAKGEEIRRNAKDAAVAANASRAAQEVGPQERQTFELDQPLREARDAFEKAYFEFHLVKEDGSMTRVAEKTGLERTHLYRKLKQLGVDLGRRRGNNGNGDLANQLIKPAKAAAADKQAQQQQPPQSAQQQPPGQQQVRIGGETSPAPLA